jgi:hypothetical protein
MSTPDCSAPPTMIVLPFIVTVILGSGAWCAAAGQGTP